jgi:cytidylate kinase
MSHAHVGTLATMIIAIDGPAAAGKSTVARAVANELGLAVLDTGAMYRAVTWAVLRRKIDPRDAAACGAVARGLRLAFGRDGKLTLDGAPAEPRIRDREVTLHVSQVSAHPEVRAAIVPLQRAEAARRGGIVAEGRDIGSVVFPDAEFKFYLAASAEVRARRRAEEEHALDRLPEILADMRRRDRSDSTRADSPLMRARDALLVDTDGVDASGVVATILAHVRGADGGRNRAD